MSSTGKNNKRVRDESEEAPKVVKKPIVFKKKKEDKKTEESKALAKAWAWVLQNTADSWVFNCDSGCFYSVCQKQIHTEGPWMVIYQPTKSMMECDDLVAAIFIKRTDKKPITQKMLKDAESEMHLIENLFLESYNNILKITDGKWTHEVNGTLEEIVQMQEPLHLVDGVLKMKFEIRGATDGCCGDRWYPAKLMKHMGESLKYVPVDDEGMVNGDMDKVLEDELYRFNKPATYAKLHNF